jgi:hypothetical protein
MASWRMSHSGGEWPRRCVNRGRHLSLLSTNDTSRRRWRKEAASTPELTHIIFVAIDHPSRGNTSAFSEINSLTSRTWEYWLGRTLTRTSRRTRIENTCGKCLRS